MSLEWDILTWKQKKALKLAIKQDRRISLKFLDNVYSDEDNARQAIQTMKNNGFLESTDIGNKFDIDKENIPEEEI